MAGIGRCTSRGSFYGVAVVVALMCGTLNADASVVRYQSIADLSRAASDVVHGVVTARVSFRDAALGRIVTRTTVRVSRALKGGGARDVVVQQMGGSVGGVKSHVIGDCEFRVGDEVVLFLTRHGATHTLLSLGQATFSVKADRAGNKFAVRDMRGLARVLGPSQVAPPGLSRRVAKNGEGSFMLPALFDEVARAIAK